MISRSTYAYSCDRPIELWGDLGTPEGNDYLELGILQVCSHIFAIASPYAMDQSWSVLKRNCQVLQNTYWVHDTGVILVLSL